MQIIHLTSYGKRNRAKKLLSKTFTLQKTKNYRSLITREDNSSFVTIVMAAQRLGAIRTDVVT
jgi:hypothetical protein